MPSEPRPASPAPTQPARATVPHNAANTASCRGLFTPRPSQVSPRSNGGFQSSLNDDYASLLQHRIVNKVKKSGLSEAISDGRPTRQPPMLGSLRSSRYWPPNVIAPRPRHVRFTPNSGHQSYIAPCPLCAKSGLMHRSKMDAHSITSSTVTSSVRAGWRCRSSLRSRN